MKTCTVCKDSKPINLFGIRRAGADGRDSKCKECGRRLKQLWRESNRDLDSARATAWAKKNPERRSSAAKKRYQAKKADILASNKARRPAYKAKNKLKLSKQAKIYRMKNKEKILVAGREHYLNNKGSYAEKRTRRRVAVKQATPPWTSSQDLSIFKKIYTQAVRLQAHVDHIIPINGDIVSGLHVIWNVQVLPASENLAKSNSLPHKEDWLAKVPA